MSLGRQWSNTENVQEGNPKQSQTRDSKMIETQIRQSG